MVLSIVLIAISSCNIWRGSISGDIFNTDGTKFLSEVSICCKPNDPNVHIAYGDPMPHYLIIKAKSNYKIDNLPKGDYTIWVVDRADNLFSNGAYTVHVPSSQNTDLKLVPGGSLAGRVIDENGYPISTTIYNGSLYQVRVTYFYDLYDVQVVYVSEDGSYSFNNLIPGEYKIKVGIGGSEPWDNVVVPSGQSIIHNFSYSNIGMP